jgi:hypothetical protein
MSKLIGPLLIAISAAMIGLSSPVDAAQGVGAGLAVSGTSNGNSASRHSKSLTMGVSRQSHARRHMTAFRPYR